MLEDGLAGLVLLAAAALPLAEMLARILWGSGISASAALVEHGVLWLAFLGAATAAREGKLLSLATTELMRESRWKRMAKALSSAIAASVSALLCYASVQLVLIDRAAQTRFGPGLPVWIAQLVLPFGMGLIALRLVAQAGAFPARILAFVGLVAGLWVGRNPGWLEEANLSLLLALIGAATLLGGPLFAAIGGIALVLFLGDGIPAAAVPAETYRMAVSPHLPAIPLFTLAGFLLAEGRTPQRLFALFKAAFGWLPGGTAVVTALLCAFLTVFTGGSGVTILILGGLLLKTLIQDGYPERFSLGLLTASGSLGLLFPPALPLILYGIVAEIPIGDLFIGGILPGMVLVGSIALLGVREGLARNTQRTPFRAGELGRALWEARYEIFLPILVLIVLMQGLATLVEAAALTAVYSFALQVLVRREISLRSGLRRVLRECTVLVGGVLLILGMSLGLTSYLVDAEVPSRLLEAVRTSIHSPTVFLLCLNGFLLIVGCLMDVFSATVVVVPLIVPLGEAFGIDPVHLGIIFIANLELGYLTPPVGLNLFLASYRFERPFLSICRAALPMLAILGVGVLVITYVPALTTGLLDWLGRQNP